MKKIIVIGLLCIFSISIQGEDEKLDSFGSNVVTQIGIIVRDIEKTSKAYAELLGVQAPDVIITDPLEKAHTEYKGDSTTAQAKLAFFHLENITIELIEPIGSPSTWQAFLDTNGEGVHHIAFQIKGMDSHISFLKQKDMPLVQKGDFTGGSYAYIDSTPQLGVMLELLTSDETE